MSVCLSVRPVAPFLLFFFFFFFFLAEELFFTLLNTKGVQLCKYASDILLVTLILNIYGFVGLDPFVLAKVPWLALF